MTLEERLSKVSEGVLDLCSGLESFSKTPKDGFAHARSLIGRISDRCTIDLGKVYSPKEEKPNPGCTSYGWLSVFLMLYSLSRCGWHSAMSALYPEKHKLLIEKIECEYQLEKKRKSLFEDTSSIDDQWTYRERIFNNRSSSGQTYRIPSEPDANQTRYEKMAEWIDYRRTRDWYDGDSDPI